MLLHPALVEALVRERQADLLRAAERRRLGHLAAHRRSRSARQRVGWFLMELGLRVAVVSEPAASLAPATPSDRSRS